MCYWNDLSCSHIAKEVLVFGHCNCVLIKWGLCFDWGLFSLYHKKSLSDHSSIFILYRLKLKKMYISEELAWGCLILKQIPFTVLCCLLYIHGWSVWWEEEFGLKFLIFLIFPNQDDQWFLIMFRYFLFICFGDIQGIV